MPSGPPELHEFWENHGPTEFGDQNAIIFLKDHGYLLTKKFFWRKPNTEHTPTDTENMALNYLCWEWDFGGTEDDRPS